MQSVLEQSKTQFSQLYPQGAFDSNFTSIITQEHFDRLLLWLEEARALGAQIVPISDNPLNKDQRKIAPHFIINPPQSAKVMKEEIFGPLLPVITYGDFTESKTQLKAHENPLALYLFTEDKNIKDEFQHSVSSGGLCINDMILHVSVDDLPFGGVRTSGIGQYHGIEGFLTFTRPKAIFQRGRFSFLGIAKPPYKSKLLPWIYRMMGIK